MNKQEQQNGVGNGMSPETITETMAQPEFVAEQLPELWQKTVETSDLTYKLVNVWNNGIDAMFQRCETYPQHAAITVILAGLPPRAWRENGQNSEQADELLKQATPEQILEALAHEQQHPDGWRSVSSHVLAGTTTKQLTGPVIQQLLWTGWLEMTARGFISGDETINYVVEHIQQRLLGGDENAWEMFCGIADDGHTIGDAARITLAVEQQHRPNRHQT